MKFILYIDYFIFYNSATTQQQHNATLRFKLSDKRASNSFYKVNVKMSSPAGELTKEQRKKEAAARRAEKVRANAEKAEKAEIKVEKVKKPEIKVVPYAFGNESERFAAAQEAVANFVPT